jgi:hypothetical protein
MKTISLFKSAATAAILAVGVGTSAFAVPTFSSGLVTDLGALTASESPFKDLHFSNAFFDVYSTNISRISTVGFDLGVLTASGHALVSTGNVSRIVSAVQPLPETHPSTLTMLLAGFGVMCAIALRRKV